MQAMVIVTSGTNCDLELAQAFEDAGASCETVHLHSILDNPEALDGAELVLDLRHHRVGGHADGLHREG